MARSSQPWRSRKPKWSTLAVANTSQAPVSPQCSSKDDCLLTDPVSHSPDSLKASPDISPVPPQLSPSDPSPPRLLPASSLSCSPPLSFPPTGKPAPPILRRASLPKEKLTWRCASFFRVLDEGSPDSPPFLVSAPLWEMRIQDRALILNPRLELGPLKLSGPSTRLQSPKRLLWAPSIFSTSLLGGVL